MQYPLTCDCQVGPKSTEADQVRSAAVRLSSFLAAPSPLLPCDELSNKLSQPLLLKLEHTLPSGSFKIRGSFNKINSVLKNVGQGQQTPQFVTSSAGNHVLACCHVWQHLGVSGSSVFVPTSVAPAKEAKLTKLHETGLIRFNKVGRECLETEQAGREFALRNPVSVYVPPYSDCDVIRGQGTSAFELFPDPVGTGWPGQLAANSDWLSAGHVTLLVPTGGGGLLSGVALYAKLACSGLQTTVIGASREVRLLAVEVSVSLVDLQMDLILPQQRFGTVVGLKTTTTVIGCQPAADCVLAKSVQAGRLLSYDEAGSLPPGPVVAFVTGGNVGDAEMELVRQLAGLVWLAK